MFRPFTLFCALLAGGSGMFLYSEKHKTTVLDQQISKIVADTEHIRQQTAVLQTDWALLNQPDRLSHLAGRFDASLKPMEPRQFVRMADLRQHLPAAVSPHAEPARPSAVASQGADTGAVVVASRAVPDVTPHEQAAEPAVVKQSVASATPVATVRKAPLVLAKAETATPVFHAPEARVPEQHQVAAQDSVKTQLADSAPVETRRSIHHTVTASDPLAVALGEKTETTTVHHASHTLVADSSATHHTASHDVASLTDTAHSTPAHHAVVTHVAVADTVARPRMTTVSTPVTVAAWHPSTAPRYVEARATYSGSLLGHSSIGGGLPPPMPVSN
ncbi:cell division protein FtsL [Acetobacter conturbans]|uniref:ABC transporter permease n=1 Tax=Acetobacter conturbans TaxID=1737472 RepID=A0ABX0K188_9PROT|nr:hypothetical protein [Acetobacter conturbans]NHN89366.1 hypothetical protein [Acetobacter conturbans]